MQAHGRINAYHNSKRQLLGNQAGQAPPAWKKPSGSGQQAEHGSKVILSRLPADVSDEEVENLFTKTVGPVKEVFIVYNSQGKSKGMAVVAFQRNKDAGIARAKFNGKIIDGS